jgi:hypothetical protein
MKITRQGVSDVIEAIIEAEATKAIEFYDEKTRIKATRRLYNGKIDKRSKSIDIVLTIGPPNYLERIMIKNALKRDKNFLKNKSLVIFPKKIKEVR